MQNKIRDSDCKVLDAIRANSRDTISQISRRINMRPNQAFQTLKKLESKYLFRYCTDLNFSAVNFGIHVLFLIKSKPLSESIIQSPNINGLYKISANSSYLIDAFFRNMIEADKFENDLKPLGVQKFYILSILKLEEAKI